MHLHHDRHLQTYIDNLNAALKNCPDLQEMSLEELICTSGKLPADIGVPVLRNAGGVYNHRFYFDGMSPPSGARPFGILAGAVNQSFTNFDRFKETLSAAALSVFGSGYAWLAGDRAGRLRVITTPNQETPLPCGFRPILNIDVWEHAYYLKHYNKRADYIGDWFSVVNWQAVSDRYLLYRRH